MAWTLGRLEGMGWANGDDMVETMNDESTAAATPEGGGGDDDDGGDYLLAAEIRYDIDKVLALHSLKAGSP